QPPHRRMPRRDPPDDHTYLRKRGDITSSTSVTRHSARLVEMRRRRCRISTEGGIPSCRRPADTGRHDFVPQEAIRNAAQAIWDMHVANVPSQHAGAAQHAAASLFSGAGHQLLYVPTELQQLITQAIEVGYATALHDVRDGGFEGEIPEWRPSLFEE
ncbi:hypothetical protein ACF1D3_12930, partial [Streptomyces sp. NPDC014728]|uniref:hypothetical protein n=1 Tax=unclassified Streptomyces TaxID=2593676 RepID=UPI0036FA59F2